MEAPKLSPHREAIRERLANNEQAMILLNRRGFSTFVACHSCGERVQCINCAVTLTYHRRDRRLLCHYCGYAEKIPTVCPKCGSEHIHFMGSGSERVEDELHLVRKMLVVVGEGGDILAQAGKMPQRRS